LLTGRVLDLNASYEVIKEAAEEAGLRCVRADEIKHSGMIDKPMYEWLYQADLVIADLSTYNVNAAYELGVRYGVRPGTTMIVAENQFKNPFDVGHIVTLPYEHLGKDIGRKEASRFKAVLVDRIRSLLVEAKPDSPVYTLLSLSPPADSEAPALASQPPVAVRDIAAIDGALPSHPAEGDANAKVLLSLARAALAADRFAEAKGLLLALRAILPRDVSVTQQLALATYRSQSPDPLTALHEAHRYLQELDPETTNDPETLGLWGAVHKKLWDLVSERRYLDEAIDSYERGFFLKQDYYNGINLAFLMDVRASLFDAAGDRAEAVADAVLARRVRRQVLLFCDRALDLETVSAADRYWIVATKWEAAVGLGDELGAARYRTEAERLAEAERPAVTPSMLAATRSQVRKLEQLLAASPLRSGSSGV
jgi:tetratricopeptide (TPR) repeat protein